MRIPRPSTLTVLTSVLVVLLPALAVLQYRWVGQVSDAEGARMERNVRIAASQFRETFDDEIARALNSLRADTTTVRESAWYRYADRYEAWSDAAEHPGIVANIFLVDAEDSVLRLRRWDTVAHSFEPAAWPKALGAWRAGFEQMLLSAGAGRGIPRVAFPDDDSLLLAALVDARGRRGQRPVPSTEVFGFTVVQLDLAYVRDAFLPALVQRHFTQSDGDRYRVAVISRADADQVVYRSDPGAPIDVSEADEVVALYGGFRGGGGRGGRGATRLGAGGVERNFGRWTLLVQHESGSLEAAVTRVRRRNLGISFGILTLLGGSIALLALSSRRAQQLAHQQMEFVAGVSHELRTPVTVIRSAAENLAQGVVDSGDRVRRYGETIESEARRLGEMVERVLQFAGIASGRALRARIPLMPAPLIDAAIESATAASGPAQVERSIAADLPPVLGDESALRSALHNLIANAIKYGGSDGWVGIRARRVVHGRRVEVQIAIDDRGPGIPGNELPHIFEPFYRGSGALAAQTHGSGLGLALVRQIVSAHDGRISVSTRPAGGSSFTIALPAAGAAHS